jgi:acyl carrier protein
MLATSEDLLELLKEIGIKPEILKNFKNDVPFLKQGFDSIDLPMMATAAEKKYKIDLSNIKATETKTMDDFVKAINNKL